MDSPYGLGWPKVFLGIEPEWTEEPDLAIACELVEQHLGLLQGNCRLKVLAEGWRNKVYLVDTGRASFVLRVSLPLDPLKVAGEVGAMLFVKANTTIPVPDVIAFDTTGNNILRFPYILMERAPGHDLTDGWQKLSLDRKRKIVTQLADFQSQLDRLDFTGIGTLQVCREPGTITPSLARITTHEFQRIPSTSRDSLKLHENAYHWLRGRLERFLFRLRNEETTNEDPADVADCEWYRGRREENATAILDFLPRIIHPDQKEEPTNLAHADLHTGNILVDDDYNITAVIDWEFQHTVPKFLAKSFPKLLQTLKRKREPNPADYDDGPDANDEYQQPLDDDSVSMYWEAREEYDGTVLRDHYIAEMEKRCTGWSEAYEKTKIHRLIEHEITVLEFNGIGCNITGRIKRYTGEGLYLGIGEPFAMEDRPCSDEYWDDYVPSWLRKGGASDPNEDDTTLIGKCVQTTGLDKIVAMDMAEQDQAEQA